MLAAIDVFATLIKTFISCLFNRKKLPKRSWRGEFISRLAKDFLLRSIGKDFSWIRSRQNLLSLYSPDLLKVNSEIRLISDVPCIQVQVKNMPESDRVIVYFHGGGYAVGCAKGYALTAAKLALLCQAKVILVDYRLVPEFALPAAQEDCYSVTRSIIQNHTSKKIILMGDSAGGALCLSTLNRLQQHNNSVEVSAVKSISAAVLISPWVAPLSYQNLSLENEATDMLDRNITQYWVDIFYQNEAQKIDIDFSDLETLKLDQNEWPKLYIQAAGVEVFLKQVLTFSEQLKQMDIEHQIDVFEDQFHVFQTFAPLVPEARTALESIARFVRQI